METVLARAKKFAAGVRSALRRAYVDQTYVGLLPTRQVLAAAVAGGLVIAVQAVFGFDLPGVYAEGLASLFVAYLIGPPAKPEEVATWQTVGHIQGLAEGLAIMDNTFEKLESRGAGDTKLPKVGGKFVGPERDKDEPGQVV